MRHWRWAVVIGAAVAITSLPVIVAHRPVDNPSISTDDLIAKVLTSATQPFEGLYRTRGGLRLPDLGRLDDEFAPFAGSSRVRVWYDTPDRWRADELLSGAERGTYRQPDGVWLWDSDRQRIVFSPRTGVEPIRIPRLMDLSPAELGRRLLAQGDGETIAGIDARRVAGHVAAGIRITPRAGSANAARSTISAVSLWADPTTGVVLEVQIDAGEKAPAFEAAFLDVDFARPDADVMQFDPAAVDQPVRQAETLDPIEQAGQLALAALPDYGSGLAMVNITVVPTANLRGRIAGLPTTVRPWGGTAALLETSLVNVQIVRTDAFAAIISGTVTMAELDRLVADLIASGVLGSETLGSA